MTEKELLNAIKKSADSVPIPESLTPEQITDNLHTFNQKQTKRHRLHNYSMQKFTSAAAVILLCGILSAVAWNTISSSENSTIKSSSSDTAEETALTSDEREVSDTTLSVKTSSKQNAGSLYTIAKNYDQVYQLLEDSINGQYRTSPTESIGIVTDMAITEEAADALTSSKQSFSSNIDTKNEGYSTTNLQTQGVDESDRIKTDGRYIYTVTGAKILITDVKDGKLTPVASIAPNLPGSDSILEMYVDNGKLILLVQHYETSMENNSSETTTENETTYIDSSDSAFLPLINDCTVNYSMNTKSQTFIYTYDVTNPHKPVLEGTTIQDGTYQTSRKIGDIVYLFTNQDFYSETFSNNDKKEFLPCINGETIPCENIYLPSQGSRELILSSIDIKKSDEIVDKVMIIHNFVNIYVGTDSIYLYETNYNNNDILTEIAGFSMKDGVINAINATTVKGEILDTFAIHESQKCLRILTTSYDASGESSNNLYLLDADMKLSGSLTDIAKGEQIYAARYFNDTAYFITYRNTDPLFAVDISNPSSPKLLGELKITGFSEYLHFWDKDKLLGIGYETDPNSGETKGLKLVMFDISNPTDLKVINTLVLENYSYSPALYNYKCVLADSNANLIGFVGEYESDSYELSYDYLLFSWEHNHFTQKMSESLSEHTYISWDYLRGIYIDDKFYIADFNQIMSFDRKNNYGKLETLVLDSNNHNE